MPDTHFVADRATVEDADRLIALFGKGAITEAATRARRSRDVGNVVHFCHWRQTERLIALLSVQEAVGTVH